MHFTSRKKVLILGFFLFFLLKMHFYLRKTWKNICTIKCIFSKSHIFNFEQKTSDGKIKFQKDLVENKPCLIRFKVDYISRCWYKALYIMYFLLCQNAIKLLWNKCDCLCFFIKLIWPWELDSYIHLEMNQTVKRFQVHLQYFLVTLIKKAEYTLPKKSGSL